MSPEIIYAGVTVASGLAGLYADQRVTENQASKEEEMHLPAVQDALIHEQLSEDGSRGEQSKLEQAKRFFGKHAVRGAVVLSIATFGGLEAYSFVQERTNLKGASTELVVDDSGSAANVLGQVQQVVGQFDSLNPETLVGNVGQTIPMHSSDFKSFSETAKGTPAGTADLYGDTSQALSKLAENSKNNSQTKGDVVVITNGNSLGNVKNLANTANGQGSKVFVVNVERSGTPTNVISDLKYLSKTTGGKFWNANSANVGQVASDVKATASPEQNNIPPTDEWPIRISGFMSLLGGLGILASRRKLIYGKNVKGE